MDDLDLDRMVAAVALPDGSPRFIWTDTRPDHETYIKVVLHPSAERQRWRAKYEAAKTVLTAAAGRVDVVSTVAKPP